jgi:O-antigen/teichoic acid export membrane protein
MSYAKDSIRTFVVKFSIMFLGLLGSVINARWLGPEGVGIVALFLLIGLSAIRFGELGYNTSFIFFIAQKKISIKDAFKIALIVSCFMVGGCCIVILLIYKKPFSPWFDFSPVVLSLGLLSITPLFFNSFFVSILRGVLNIKAINIASIIRTFCYIPTLAVFIILLKTGVVGAICSYIASEFVVSIYLLVCIKKHYDFSKGPEKTNSSWKIMFELWQYGRWNYLRSLTSFLYAQLPIVILKYFYANAIVGFFSMSKGLINRVLLLPQSFSINLFAFTSASQEDEATRRTNITSRIFCFVNLCLVVFVAIIAKPLIIYLYGEAFTPAVNVIYCLLPLILFLPLYQFITEHFAGFGKPQIPFILRIVVLPICIMLYYFFVSRYGAIGAAVAQSLLYVLLTILSLLYYIKLTKTNLADVVIPRKEDLILCKKLFQKILEEVFQKKTGLTFKGGVLKKST